jgi:hypothetical protein
LPSKKFIIFVLIILLAGAGIFLLLKGGKLKKENKTVFQRQENFVSAFLQQNRKDSDNDGLADWEEILWKTDPNNPDTDKDGTPDGEEVKLGRNPTKPGPNDLLSSNIAFQDQTNDTAGAEFNPSSETEKFSQDFLTQYLVAKQTAGGNNLDTAAKDNLVNSLVNSVNSAPVVLVYKISDIKTSGDNSNETLKNYGNRIGEIFKSHLNPEPGTEIYTFRDAVKNNDQNKFEELGKNVKNYQELVNDCLNLVAPSAVKDNHLQLVNNLALLRDITSKFQNFPNDPVGSMVGIEQYPEAYVNLAASLAKTDAHFKNKGIFFNKNDGWYFIQSQLNEK